MIKLSQPVDASDQLFPNRPNPPVPSTFDTSELVGRYIDDGYGEIDLQEEEDPQSPGHKKLVADRSHMSWQEKLTLKHATGDFWIVYVTTPANPTFIFEFSPGEFRRGKDGKVASLEVEWKSRLGSGDEGTTVFKRVV